MTTKARPGRKAGTRKKKLRGGTNDPPAEPVRIADTGDPTIDAAYAEIQKPAEANGHVGTVADAVDLVVERAEEHEAPVNRRGRRRDRQADEGRPAGEEEVISFTVPAVPVPQPRPRAVLAHGGLGARVHEVTHIKNARTGERKAHPIVAFKATVRLAAERAYQGPPLAGPLDMTLGFVMPRPASLVWKTRPMPRAWHGKKPDVDNLVKSTLDALRGLLFVDDGQVARLWLSKVIAAGGESPRVLVTLKTLDHC